MKTTSLLTLTVTLLSLSGFAQGSDVIIRQRARGLSNQNNARQGVTPPPVAPGQTTAPATTLSAGALKVQADLAAIKPGSTLSPEKKELLAQHLTSVAEGTTKSTCTPATRLAEELSAALSEHPLPAAGRARLAQELDALLNPGKYPQAKPEGIYTDIQATLQGLGLSRSRATGIVDQIKALVTEAR